MEFKLFFNRVAKFALILSIFISSITLAEATDYRFNTLKLSDGLPSNTVFQIFQQSNGYIWFATDEGLSRFDGHDYRNYNYNPGDKFHISNNFVSRIIEDKNNNIWVATDNGLNKINSNGDIEQFYKDKTDSKSLSSNWITSLLERSEGGLWVGTGHGLSLYNELTNTFSRIGADFVENGDFYTVYTLAQDSAGKLWAGTSYGLAYFDANQNTLTLLTSKNSEIEKTFRDEIDDLLVVNDDYLYVASVQFGMYKVNLQTFNITLIPHLTESQQKPEKNSVSALALINNDQVWFGTNEGVYIYHPKDQKLENIRHKENNLQSLPNNYVLTIFEDKSGVIWISTGDGIAYYSPLKKSTSLYSKSSNTSVLSDNVVNHIALDNMGNAWLATDNGLNKLDINNKDITHFIPSLSNDKTDKKQIPKYIWNLTHGLDGNIWMAHPKGLSVFNANNNSLIHYDNAPDNKFNLPNYEFFTVVSDAEGGVWFTGYIDVGLIHFHPEKGIIDRYLNSSESIYSGDGHFTYDMLRSKNGEIWLATTNGVYRINPLTKTVSNYQLSEQSSNIRATSIVEDRDGVIWVASQGAGLARLQSDKNEPSKVDISFITEDNGLPSNSITSISLGIDNELWLTTHSKLLKYNTLSKNITRYSSLLDNKMALFSGLPSKFESGFLYLALNKGLLEVDTRALVSNLYSPPVHITQVISSNQNEKISVSLNDVEPTVFSYEQNNLQFKFSALDYTDIKQNIYRYKLEGFDEHWIEAGSNNLVMYTNLDAGDYTFKVQGTNSDGLWSTHEAVFSFRVKEAWWYYALYTLLCLLALFALIIIYSRHSKFKEFKHLANLDSLTGLANRYRFNTELERIINSEEASFSLIFLDLDNFKDINDTMGHDVGDKLIVEVSKRLSDSVRGHDLLARLGGDEFAIIIHNQGSMQHLTRIMNRIERGLNNGYQIDDHWISNTASIGVANYPDDGVDSATLLKNADTAMYAAKNNGRNNIYYFENKLSQQVKSQMKIRNKLYNALKNNQFELYYQPKICCSTGKIVGFEALIRWFDPIEGCILPDVFIPEAEKNGMILDIGYWVLEQTCQQIAMWQKQGIYLENISVNVSVYQLIQPNFVEQLQVQLEKYNFAPNILELEITESLFLEDTVRALDVLTQIKKLNVNIALDDFGTGYSSLNYISKYPIDTLKIDRSFVENCFNDKSANKLLSIVFTLAEHFNMRVVAEGVETIDQRNVLLGFGCQYAQGFLFSKAVNANNATQLVYDLNYKQAKTTSLSSC